MFRNFLGSMESVHCHTDAVFCVGRDRIILITPL